MADSDIELKITVNDSALEKGEQGLESLGREANKTARQIEKIDEEDLSKIRQSIERTEQRFKSMASVAKGVGGALAVGKIAEVGKEFLLLGARVSASEDSLRTMLSGKGIDPALFLADMREATKGLATDVDLMQQSVRAVSFGIPIEQLAALTEATTHYARVTGRDVPEAINRMVQGIGKQETEWLDELGLKIKLSEAKSRYAEQTHKLVSELTSEEIQLAFTNEALRQFAENNGKIGPAQDRTIDSVNRLIVAFENQKNELVQSIVEAEGFEQGMISLTQVIISGAKSILYAAGALDRFGNFLAKNVNGMEVASVQIDEVFNKIEGGSEIMGRFYSQQIQDQKKFREEWEKTNKGSRFIPGAGPQADPKGAYNASIVAAQSAIDKLKQMGVAEPERVFVKLNQGVAEFSQFASTPLAVLQDKIQSFEWPDPPEEITKELTLSAKEATRYEKQLFKLTASTQGLSVEAAKLAELRKNGGAAEEIAYLEKIVAAQDQLKAQKKAEKEGRKAEAAARKQKAKDDRAEKKRLEEIKREQEKISESYQRMVEDFKQTEKYKDIWEDYSKGLISYDEALRDVRDAMVGYQAITAESVQATAELDKAAEGFAKGKGSFEDLAEGMLKAEKAGAQLQKFGEKSQGSQGNGFLEGILGGIGIDPGMIKDTLGVDLGSIFGEVFSQEGGGDYGSMLGSSIAGLFEGGKGDKEIGAEVGSMVVGGVAAFFGGPAAGMIAQQISSQVLPDIISAFGKDSKGTELRKEIDKFFAEAFDANRIALVIDGELMQLDDLAIKPNLEGGLFDTLAEDTQRKFETLGTAVGSFFGEFGKLAENGINLGRVFANNLGGDLNNLQLALQSAGISADQLEDQLIKAFMAGDVSAVEVSSSLNEVDELFKVGIPGSIGDTQQAFTNFINSGGRGLPAIDAMRDLAAEALETGGKIKTLGDLQADLLAKGADPEQLKAFFAALDANGIDSLEKLRDISDRGAINIIGNLQTDNFAGFGDVASEMQKLSEYAENLDQEREIRVKIRADYSDKDIKAIETASGYKIPNIKSGGAFA